LVDFFAGTLGTPFIVGPTTSSDSLAAVTHLVASHYPTVLISPSATSPALTTVVDSLDSGRPGLFWRTAPSDAFQGAKLATDVIGQYPVADCGGGMGGGGGDPAAVNKVAIIHIKDAYGSGLANVFFENFVSGSREAEFVPFAQGDDLKTIADNLLASNFKPDGFLIVTIDSKNTLSLMGALSDYVLQPGQEHRRVYLTDGSKSDLLLAVDPVRDPNLHTVVFERTVGTAPASPDPNGALYKAFETSIEKEFSGVVANEHSFIAHTYDAAYVASAGVVYAMTKMSSSFTGEVVAEGMGFLSSSAMGAPQPGVGFDDWPQLKAAMQNSGPIVNIRGVTGQLDFDDSGEPTANLEVWQPCAPVFCTGGVPCFTQVGTI
jgi:ABC-type branched-subunit amino acid transport system substrate-binding protein